MGLFDQERHPSADWDLTTRPFKSKFGGGSCIASGDHPIERGDWIAMGRPVDQPMSPRRGPLCADCTTRIQKRKKSG
jgi:hypothetical protein